jgi:predicted ATPase/DNA-binding winged helix-turn-helix (wHTH) protein
MKAKCLLAQDIEGVFYFGPFRLLPARQLLLEGDTPVRLGSRALEILTALVARPGELVSKDELIARAWPNTVVEDSNLKVNIAALRRALGERRLGQRYIATVSGRGYRFVAPVECGELSAAAPARRSPGPHAHNLPVPKRTIGRAHIVEVLLQQLPRSRFVTVVGPGGIGKTTVALAVAHALVADYQDGVRFVDLAPLPDTHFVPGAIASALGLTMQFGDARPALIDYLRDRPVLILLDSCERVIEAAASFADDVIRNAPKVVILATSREPLRVSGEHVHRLAPLENPPSVVGLTAAQALAFPAVQLFVERATESLDGFQLSDGNAPIVADICHKLEGIALAIELAATRVDAFGLRELSALLSDRFRLLNQDRRTALPRHRSLAAALDWSYELLPDGERVILRRLAVFAGAFTLESATAVAGETGNACSAVIDGVANLVAKSLISADTSGVLVQYRLLDTTRAYALQKLDESGELEAVTRRHAEHHRDLFERAATEWEARPTVEWLADYGRKIDDVRSALNWAFSEGGDAVVGMSLTVAAIPLWMHLSLLDECRECVNRALSTETAARRPSERDQMKLYAALGAALMNGRGPLPETESVWTKALRIAERVDDGEYQLRALWGLSVYHTYVGNHRTALGLAERFRAVAAEKGDRAARISIDRLAAAALRYLGDQAGARRHLERMLSQYVAPVHRSHIARFQFDQRAGALSTLSNVLWLQGFPDQAVHAAQNALLDAQASNHALTLSNAFAYTACPLPLYVGNWTEAQRLLAMFREHLKRHPMTVWNALSACLQGILLIRQGDAAGLPLLRSALDELKDAKLRLRYPEYLGALADGLGAHGQGAEGRAAVDEAIAWSEQSGERWCMAELLRVKADILRLEGTPTAHRSAEDQYLGALECARSQQVLSLELRAATSLAQLWAHQGRCEKAEKLLAPVYSRFTEGFETIDLKTARTLLERLRVAKA